MKKLLFALLIFTACEKDDNSPARPADPVNTDNFVVQIQSNAMYPAFSIYSYDSSQTLYSFNPSLTDHDFLAPISWSVDLPAGNYLFKCEAIKDIDDTTSLMFDNNMVWVAAVVRMDGLTLMDSSNTDPGTLSYPRALLMLDFTVN